MTERALSITPSALQSIDGNSIHCRRNVDIQLSASPAIASSVRTKPPSRCWPFAPGNLAQHCKAEHRRDRRM